MSRRVLVVGRGNAALCAAIAACEEGAEVTVLERAPERLAGGNSVLTDGSLRVAYESSEQLLELMPDLSEQERETIEFEPYDGVRYWEELTSASAYRTDPDLAAMVIDQSFDAVRWLQDKGIRFVPQYGASSVRDGEKIRFVGGLSIETVGGGEGLVADLVARATRGGAEIRYGHRALSLLHDDDGVHGVAAASEGRTVEIEADAVVLAAGGFEANTQWRSQYLGPGWDLARVRGSRFNTGDGISMALAAGAASTGHWSGCHAVPWDLNAPDFSGSPNFYRYSYPIGIMVNVEGDRFLDEGADFWAYTYAAYGHKILAQPAQTAWQLFDGKSVPLLRQEYNGREVTKFTAESLEELVEKIPDVNADRILRTVAAYNDAVDEEVPFDLAKKDGKRTVGLAIDKSNWARKLDTPPFHAYGVTCGISFTYGGLRVNTEAKVLGEADRPIGGLYAAGELVGGLYYFNLPGGVGLVSGTVLGRTAGRNAAAPVAA
ncbi:MAG TPA: FAD-dependent tricarballylate dehydrogenase TcuA [Solirubrobacterales bacterium]|nr:FAD-dependent tricarballylate dehydrogenase TcuA [Solirubrobacterales bacterium]